MTGRLRMFAVLGAFVLIGAACQQQAEDGADGDQAGGAQATCDADEFGCVETPRATRSRSGRSW